MARSRTTTSPRLRPDYSSERLTYAAPSLGRQRHRITRLTIFVTSAPRAGVPINQVAEWLGDDPRTVLKVYAHVLGEEQNKEALRRLNSLASHWPETSASIDPEHVGESKTDRKIGSDQDFYCGDEGI